MGARILVLSLALFLHGLGCASPSLNVFQEWDARLHEMVSAPSPQNREDVSLLVGSTPTKCEPVPATGPKIGIFWEDLIITKVLPASPAAVAGITPGLTIRSVNGTPVVSELAISSILRAAVKAGEAVTLSTDAGLFTASPKVPTLEQCYWETRSGSTANARFYRVSCRFSDGNLVRWQSYWQR